MASFGENLRRERELRGASLRDIADATKISTRFLEALEQDRLEILPGGIYPRAFVRQYARYLGLDADRLTAEFVYAHRVQAAPEPSAQHGSTGAWRRVLAGAVAAAVAVLAVLWLLPSLRQGSAPSEPVPVAAPASVAASPADAPVESVYAAPVEPEPEPPEGLVLTLRAQQSCWVGVEVDGRSVLNRVLGAGESETLQADSEIVLSVGNAGGISYTLNDRPGVSLGQSGEVRRNIVITRQSLQSFVDDEAVRGS